MTVEKLLLEGNKITHKDMSRLILATLLEKNPLELTLHLDLEVPKEIVIKYQKCLENLKKGLPLQYALNSTNFMGLDFYVDSRVLIPRFETEELVDNTNNYLKKYFNKNIQVLDLCSGSGCIGLTLKYYNPTFNITLVDISKDALDVSKINANNFNLKVNFQESDLFQNIKEKYDVIISNPPYIGQNDKIEDIVFQNEPHLALYANNNGLEFYERILSSCENYLNSKYLIAFEIGSNQLEKIRDLINKYLKDVKVISKKDLSNRDRMVFIFKNVNFNE